LKRLNLRLSQKNNLKTTDPQFRTLLKETSAVTGDFSMGDDSFSNRIKTFLKRWPWLFNFLKKAIGSGHSPGGRYHQKERIKKLFGDSVHNKVILSLGSGATRIHPEIINVDIRAFKEVDLVADVTDMPLQDKTVDGIVCDSLLEHVANAPKFLREMARILKPGGTLILSIPFMLPYHSSPNDFFRWTEEGIRHVLKENNFRVEEVGIIGGPMGALQGMLMHIFAILFSFGSKTLYFLLVQFFMVLFSPLKLLDVFLMPFAFSIEAASNIFVIAEKNK